uniref:NADH-ubiquinone oxidoreductase chain 4L n=1 Tax=Cephalopina titillator TaxID=2707115 RepID=A0A6C0UAL8_9MUSC|nr:NADH dehydrogenase subunit 4L [Cephalopina titillator]QIB71455.1 NADH dehydrogenase subunit 4L [Cephalopina titillator]
MIILFYWNVVGILFFFGVFSFVLNRKHLLSMLLSLEFVVLILFLLLFMYLNLMNYELYFSMMYLIFSVCEGALGLSILVSSIRTHGNDYFQSFSMLEC